MGISSLQPVEFLPSDEPLLEWTQPKDCQIVVFVSTLKLRQDQAREGKKVVKRLIIGDGVCSFCVSQLVQCLAQGQLLQHSYMLVRDRQDVAGIVRIRYHQIAHLLQQQSLCSPASSRAC